MPIDKNTAPIIKASIKTQYGPVLERTLLTFILKDLTEIMSSMKVTGNANMSFAARMQAREEALQSTSIKRSLIVRLNALKHLRHEIAEEVLKQYNLKLPLDEIVFYHDEMEALLQTYEKQLEEWIIGGAYNLINNRLNQLLGH